MTTFTHKTTITRHYAGDKYTYKVFDYNDGVDLSDDDVDNQYVVNVPCYNLQDLSQMLHGDKWHSHSVKFDFKNKNTDRIDIETSNHRGRKHQYILATPEVDKFVKEQSIVGGLMGHITKTPKRHTKIVRVHQRSSRTDCYIEDKWDTMWIKNELEKIA